MFDNLTNRLSQMMRKISGRGRLTEENIKDTLREVRIALLEADVSLPVIKDFINKVKNNAINIDINNSLTPGQTFIKIVYNELVLSMGKENYTLNLNVSPPAIILVVGLNGVGKTTSIGKLGKFLREKHKKRVLLVSTDINRPAAIKQLEILAQQAMVDFCPSDVTQQPMTIINNALKMAKLNLHDVLLIDTSGRFHVNKSMMEELKRIHTMINPVETLFVVDAMTGQDSFNIAKLFDESIPLTGIILTKVDSDARGGVALSIRHITNKPIKFIGVGEKNEALEPFYPERIASRILGMGDVLSLIENIESQDNYNLVKRLEKKFKKDSCFNFNDFLEQLIQMRNMGGITNIIDKLPNSSKLQNTINEHIDDNLFITIEAIINSMTYKERLKPEIIKGSRKRRIAIGAGKNVQDINKVLKQFNIMQRIMKKGGMAKIINNIKGFYNIKNIK